VAIRKQNAEGAPTLGYSYYKNTLYLVRY